MRVGAFSLFVCLACLHATGTQAMWTDPSVLDACPGYTATNVTSSGSTLTATLALAGTPCNVFGEDIETLTLEVTYETTSRIHVKITDPTTPRYEVPEAVFPRPVADTAVDPSGAQINFEYTESPFTFSIVRSSTSEVLFSTEDHPIIFESQYLRVKSALPTDPNIYGLGEHSNPLRLPPDNTTLTLWNRDAYGIPVGTNLYGSHPIYFEHRTTGTHGVFLLNSNGADIKLTQTEGSASLEYNVIGGVLDFYFFAGSESDPIEVARQYAQVAGYPAEVPYWSFGLHQCRYGYTDYVDVANVIWNYSLAEIPLETMWTDIDYMYKRRVFTLDPDYFPLDRMQQIIDYLHDHDQKYILMTDPAVAYITDGSYDAYNRGTEQDVWIKAANGSYSLGLVWPGVTVFPDWFNPETQDYWTTEFSIFYNAETGLDIDGAWIDMNEPSSFCVLPCTNIYEQAKEGGYPPNRTTPAPSPDAIIFGSLTRREEDNLLTPPYSIDNAAGELSNKTAFTNSVQYINLTMYNTHNLFGTMMSNATHVAMETRRPGLRTVVITRSTFAGAGKHTGKWLGDNLSTWEKYRESIAGMLAMTSIYQIPMVGSDICGYGDNTTMQLCARWAMLGGFYPFMRNHNALGSISQEFYRWPVVAQAARNVLDMRYRLLDYIYTAFHTAHTDGTPVLSPMWFLYPNDTNTFAIDFQYFYGPSILVSPVTEENATSVTAYLPDDVFYDFQTFAVVQGQGANVTFDNIDLTEIPVHIKGGAILPLRMEGVMTTAALRDIDFEFVIAPDTYGNAYGSLYLDDGVSIEPKAMTLITMRYTDGMLSVTGEFSESVDLVVRRVQVLGQTSAPTFASVDCEADISDNISFNSSTGVVDVPLGLMLTQNFMLQLMWSS